MNKKVITISISIVCVVALSVVVIATLFKNGVIEKDNIFSSNNDAATNNTQDEAKQNSADYPTFEILLKKGASFALQYQTEKSKPKEYEDINITFNNLTITKSLGDFDKCDDWYEKKDSDGNITSNHSYIIADVTLENRGKSTLETTVNNVSLLLGDDNMYELRTYNSGKSTRGKDYFLEYFEPNKEYRFNLVFIAEDELINQYSDSTYLYASFFGMWTGIKPKIIG